MCGHCHSSLLRLDAVQDLVQTRGPMLGWLNGAFDSVNDPSWHHLACGPSDVAFKCFFTDAGSWRCEMSSVERARSTWSGVQNKARFTCQPCLLLPCASSMKSSTHTSQERSGCCGDASLVVASPVVPSCHWEQSQRPRLCRGDALETFGCSRWLGWLGRRLFQWQRRSAVVIPSIPLAV